MTTTDAEAIARFAQYRRKQIAELRPWQPGDDMSYISVSAEDAKDGSPKIGDMIARNPKNHADQWLVAAQYFADNFEPLASRREAQEPVAPSDCVDRMNCGLRRIATEPDIGLTACSRPNCPHTTQALSAPPSPAPAGEVERLRRALEFYANPEVYKPHPHGPAFDRRDLSAVALAALNGGRSE